jgi:2-aminoadipate transaminase
MSVEKGLEFAPGNFFYTGRRDSNNLRLSFSTLNQPQIRQGIKRLGAVMEEFLAEKGEAAADKAG